MMAVPVRLQLSRRKGFNLQRLSRETNGLEAVNVARPSIFGNPFCSPPDAPRSLAFESGIFRDWIIEVMGVTHLRKSEKQEFIKFLRRMAGGGDDGRLRQLGEKMRGALPLLRGKNLACWCPLPKAGEPDVCHATVLLDLAATLPTEEPHA